MTIFTGVHPIPPTTTLCSGGAAGEGSSPAPLPWSILMYGVGSKELISEALLSGKCNLELMSEI